MDLINVKPPVKFRNTWTINTIERKVKEYLVDKNYLDNFKTAQLNLQWDYNKSLSSPPSAVGNIKDSETGKNIYNLEVIPQGYSCLNDEIDKADLKSVRTGSIDDKSEMVKLIKELFGRGVKEEVQGEGAVGSGI